MSLDKDITALLEAGCTVSMVGAPGALSVTVTSPLAVTTTYTRASRFTLSTTQFLRLVLGNAVELLSTSPQSPVSSAPTSSSTQESER